MTPGSALPRQSISLVSDAGLSDFDRRHLPSTMRRAASLLERHLPVSEQAFDAGTIRRLRAGADAIDAGEQL